jgi:Leucine-rich repeat (LRR) protein
MNADFSDVQFINTKMLGVDLRFVRPSGEGLLFEGNELAHCIIDEEARWLSINQFVTANCKVTQSNEVQIHFNKEKYSAIRGALDDVDVLVERLIAATALSKSKFIHLSYMGLTHIPVALLELSYLEVVSLNGNQLTVDQLSLLFEYLPNIKYFYLQENKLSRLPTNIAQLSQLAFLDLGENKLAVLPGYLSELGELRGA